MPHFEFSRKTLPRSLVAILLAAVALRIAYLLIYAGLPDWSILTVDNYFHLHWSENIAEGNLLGDTTYFRAPFYIYCLAILNFLFGYSLWAFRIFGMIAGVAAVVVTYLTARKMFSERTAVIAAIIHLLYPIVLYFESELLLDALFMFLLEVSFYRFLIWQENKITRNLFWLGLSLGIASITRPTALIFVPFVLLLLLAQRNAVKLRFKSAAVLLGGLFLVILPITVRNISIGGEAVLISAQGGINSYIGNNYRSDGLSAKLPEPLGHNWEIRDISYIAEKQTGKKLKPGEVSSFWFGQTIDEFINHPVEIMTLFLKKLYFNISNHEISNNRNLNDFFKRHLLLNFNPLTFAFIFALAVFGVVGGWKSHDGTKILTAVILIYTFSVALFFFNSRFRLPVLPFYFILTAAGIESILTYLKRPNWALLVPALAATAAAVVSFAPVVALPSGAQSQHFITGGLNHYAQNEIDSALESFKAAAKIDSTFPETNLNIGACYLRLGNTDSARYYFEKEIKYNKMRPLGYSNIASLELLDKQYETAIKFSDIAIKLKPYLVEPHLIKLRALSEIDSIDVEEFYQTSLMAAFQTRHEPSVLNLAAIVLTNKGDLIHAREFLEIAAGARTPPIEINDKAFRPDFYRLQDQFTKEIAKANYQLGFVLGMQNEFKLSVSRSRKAIELDPSIAEAYLNLSNGFNALGNYRRADSVLNEMRKRFPGHGYFQGK